MQSLQREREAYINVMRDELLVFNALILYPWEHIKVLEGDMNTSKTELESLRLEYEWSKITTRESSHKLLRLSMEVTKLGDQIDICSLRLGDHTGDI